MPNLTYQFTVGFSDATEQYPAEYYFFPVSSAIDDSSLRIGNCLLHTRELTPDEKDAFYRQPLQPVFAQVDDVLTRLGTYPSLEQIIWDVTGGTLRMLYTDRAGETYPIMPEHTEQEPSA